MKNNKDQNKDKKSSYLKFNKEINISNANISDTI